MATLKTFLFSEDARAQAEFYIDALGGEMNSVITYGEAPGAEGNTAGKDKVMHMCITVSGVTIFMADSLDPLTRGNDFSLNLEFKDADEGKAAFENLATGGRIVKPLDSVFWGGLYGELEDKFGVSWMISS
ncbi:VOC family protein [Bacillus horti]|uniref:PhnB protein n=1 Tax=Caldalkalibacillus horti TaxID=77523 RepID=A0ABT9W086_9BACI|nr:VOC family protein [Bacillus horti]MDQ0166505.1 PhnB protein [Bacillus horti]